MKERMLDEKEDGGTCKLQPAMTENKGRVCCVRMRKFALKRKPSLWEAISVLPEIGGSLIRIKDHEKMTTPCGARTHDLWLIRPSL